MKPTTIPRRKKRKEKEKGKGNAVEDLLFWGG